MAHSYSSIIHWNLQSYRTHFEDLKLLIHDFFPACVCLQETLIRHSSTFPPSQYGIFTSTVSRNDLHERGSAILVHKSVHSTIVPLQTNLQAVAVRLRLRREYTVCSLYLPHVDTSYRDVEQLLLQLPPPFLLLGDMNAWSTVWGNRSTNDRGRLFERLLLNHDIMLLNDGTPTHYHQQTNTLSTIDLSICSSNCFTDFNYEVISSLYGSDHYPTQLSLVQPDTTREKFSSFNARKADWALFGLLTEVAGLEVLPTVEEKLEGITRAITEAASASMPVGRGSLGRPPLPWWNNACDDAKRERSRAENAMKRNPTLFNTLRYKRARATCRYIFKKSRRESWLHFLSSINSRTAMTTIWKRIKRLQGRFSVSPHPVLRDAVGEIEEDSYAVANIFAEHYASVGGTDAGDVPLDIEKELCSPHRPYNSPISPGEFREALGACTDSAPGHDRISYCMIKRSHPTMKARILDLYNTIFSTGQFPASWKISIIIPLPKAGKDLTEPASYRPISLTCCLCKLLEKILNYRLMWHLESQSAINPCQSGFRHFRSSTDHLVALDTLIRNSIARKEHVLAVFFDLQKAYDTARRDVILDVLRAGGVGGNLYVFIWNFLHGRRIQVRVGSNHSEITPVYQGVPQGSVLSCTCFLLAVNALGNGLPGPVRKLLYVDDFAILASSKRPNSAARQLQLSLNQIDQWCNVTGFRFSTQKTASMHICRVRNCSKCSPQLTLGRTELAHVPSYKYLGLLIDDSLTWKLHISHLKTAAISSLNVLKCVSGPASGADRTTLSRLYLAITKPKLDYGSEAYGSACRTLLQSLQPVQNAALRIITGAYRTTPIDSLHAETGIKSLERFRHIKEFNYMLRVNANPDRSILHLISDIDLTRFQRNEKLPKPLYVRYLSTLEMYNVLLPSMAADSLGMAPPWSPCPLHVCEGLHHLRKGEHDSSQLSVLFSNHQTLHNHDRIYYTDGSKSDDGTGFAFIHGDHTHQTHLPSCASIYTAELLAISEAIAHAIHHSYHRITIFTDSRSAIQGLVKYIYYHPIVSSIKDRLRQSDCHVTLCWVPSHSGIRGNEHADAAAKAAIALPFVSNTGMPRTDLKYLFKSLVGRVWQDEWHATVGNKLREIKNCVGPFSSSFQRIRAWECKLARLRFGHTVLTHSYLMSGDQRPYCEDCLVPLTIVHVLLECPSMADARRAHLWPNENVPLTLQSLLGTFGPASSSGPLSAFLKAVNLYHEL